MPVYEYFCEQCSVVHEDMVSNPDKMKKTIICEDCGKRIKHSFITPPTMRGGAIRGEGTGISQSKYYQDMQKAATDMRMDHSNDQKDCDKLKGESPYSNMTMDVGKLVKSGRARRGTPEELKKKKENMRKVKENLLPRVRRQYKDDNGDK